ncbi:MAG: TonB-dependent receptor [Rhodothermales bacterium]|nr:TonB-dependent receptor [Rhodothermales bacterium]
MPLNVFGAGNISAEGADFIRIDNVQNRTDRTQKLANIVVTGPLLDGWAGSIDAALGITWRSDEGSFAADEALFTGDALGFGGESSIDGSEEVWELYGETVVPLAENTAWADYLGLEIGARYSSYENAGEHWTYKLGGEWQPVDGLRLRSMYQRSVRAPNIAELFEEQFTSSAFPFGSMPDPCSASSDPVANGNQEKCIIQGLQSTQIGVFEANTLLPSDYVRGGNPNLDPEEANTYTVGAVLDLDALPNWTIAIDYFDLEVTDTIGTIDALAICFDPLNTSSLFCDNISRSASGEVSQIVELTSNRGLLRTKGIDTQLAYTTDLPAALAIGDSIANLKLNAVWTHTLTIDMQENPTTQILECAGRFGSPCFDGSVFVTGQTFARNRFTAFANYDSGPLTLHLTWRWIDGTDNAAPLDVRFSGSPDSLAIPNVDSESYVDLGVGYRFSDRFVTRLNINNLFDTDPPQMADAVAGINTDSGMYDVFGRSYVVSFSAGF